VHNAPYVRNNNGMRLRVLSPVIEFVFGFIVERYSCIRKQ